MVVRHAMPQAQSMNREMLAVVIREPGPLEVITCQSVPRPALRPRAVRIAVRAAGVSAGDALFRKGSMQPAGGYPWIPGFEVAGEVAEVGSEVSGLATGDRVVALLRGGGGNAQEVVVDANRVQHIPRAVSYAKAAAVLSNGLSAMGALHRAGPQTGTVVVSAAAGAVGSLLVQLAKKGGATSVIALAGAAEKLEAAKRLGADHVISYRVESWASEVMEASGDRGADLVLEAVGGEVFSKSLTILAQGGTLLSYGAASGSWPTLQPPQLMALGFGNQSLTGFVLQSYLESEHFTLVERVEALLAMVSSGALHVPAQEYSLEEAARAHAALDGRELIGKAVLTLP